jgi:GT2 family glycosyltransferase
LSFISRLGFAKANNLALESASGKYILFINPDVIVGEHTITDCIAFNDRTDEAGAVGVKMLDGSGTFLKESKRGFPSPATSLFKLSGLSDLFPHSKTFSKYYLGHLDENENHVLDVLAGAFMLVRK